jgi:hypothetical protein
VINLEQDGKVVCISPFHLLPPPFHMLTLFSFSSRILHEASQCTATCRFVHLDCLSCLSQPDCRALCLSFIFF